MQNTSTSTFDEATVAL